MAAPMSVKMGWLKYPVILGLSLFLANKIIVSYYLTDYWRAKVLRFQLSIFLQAFYSSMAAYVWWTLSPLLDREDRRELKPADFFSLESKSFESKLWKTLLGFILLSSCLIYPTFSFFMTGPYSITYFIGICWAVNITLFGGSVIVNAVCLMLRLCKRSRIEHTTRSRLHLLAVFYTIIATVYGFYNATRPPALKEVEIPVKQLPADLEGMTITFIPDIHLGPTTGRAHFEKIVHAVNFLQSDVVIIGGDLVDGSVDKLKDCIEPLEWVNPKYGVYFVTGNHEYYTADVLNWFLKLESIGVSILHNSHVWLPSQDNRGLCLAGVDDEQGEDIKYMDHKMDIDKALRSCGSSSPVVLISHRPSGAKAAFDSNHRVDLVLSGHTHGGQIFPISVGAYLFNPYYAGLYKHGDSSHVYVSMGTRFWGFPVRFGTRSEITKITLKKSD